MYLPICSFFPFACLVFWPLSCIPGGLIASICLIAVFCPWLFFIIPCVFMFRLPFTGYFQFARVFLSVRVSLRWVALLLGTQACICDVPVLRSHLFHNVTVFVVHIRGRVLDD